MSATSQEGTGSHQLQAILPDWCALSWQNALVCLTFVVLFLHLCYLPVPTGQVWHEIVNGQAITQNGIATPDPALAYSQGVRTLTTNWLGQSIVYWTYHLGGPEWLSCVFALIQLATLAIWGFVFQRISGSSWAALLVAPILIASSIDVNALGSSILGLFVFALIALTIVNTFKSAEAESEPSQFAWRSASLWQWIAVVSLFVVWANIDLSVLIGVGLLGTFALSRLIGVLANRQGHSSLMNDSELHRRTWLFEICLVATLIQPAGLGLWQAIFWSSNNPIVQGFGGWDPVTIASWRGVWIAIAWLGWIVASRWASSIPLWNIGGAILLTIFVACFQGQIVWFATTMCFLTVALFPKAVRREATSSTETQRLNDSKDGDSKTSDSKLSDSKLSDSKPALKFAFTLVCGLLVWIGFSLSPIGTMAMGGKQRTSDQLYVSSTPLGATAFLKSNRPEKVVWTPKYWADYLQVEGGPTPVMANLNDALLTPRIEKDYQSIYYGGKNWQRLLRRYQIHDLVVDKENQTELMRELRVNAGSLKKVYEDDLSVVYRRSGDAVGSTPTIEPAIKTPRIETASSPAKQPRDHEQSRFGKASFQNRSLGATNSPNSSGSHSSHSAGSQTRVNKSGSGSKPTRKTKSGSSLFGEQNNTTSIFGD